MFVFRNIIEQNSLRSGVISLIKGGEKGRERSGEKKGGGLGNALTRLRHRDELNYFLCTNYKLYNLERFIQLLQNPNYVMERYKT